MKFRLSDIQVKEVNHGPALVRRNFYTVTWSLLLILQSQNQLSYVYTDNSFIYSLSLCVYVHVYDPFFPQPRPNVIFPASLLMNHQKHNRNGAVVLSFFPSICHHPKPQTLIPTTCSWIITIIIKTLFQHMHSLLPIPFFLRHKRPQNLITD